MKIARINFQKRTVFRVAILLLILVGISFVLFHKFLITKFTDTFLTKYQEVAVRDVFVGGAGDSDGEHTFASPLAPEGMIVRYISSRTPGIIHFNFKEPIALDGFSLYFYGDTHSVSSALAEDFWIYYLDEKNEWNLAKEVWDNTSPVYNFRSLKTISTKSIEIIISKAFFNDNIHYGDVKFYAKEKVGFFKGIKLFAENHQRSLVARLVYYLIFLVILFLPGFVLIDAVFRKKKFSLDSDLKLIFSPIFSVVFWSLSSLVYYFTGSRLLFSFFWLIFFCTLIILLKKKRYFFKELTESRHLLIVMGLALLMIFLVMAERAYLFNLPYIYRYLDKLNPIPMMTGYYGYEADNLFQWGLARMFSNRLSPWDPNAGHLFLEGSRTAIFDRTPTLPLATAFVLNFFGQSHFIYERFIEILAVLMYGGAYLAIKSFFSKRTALIVGFLMILSVHLSCYAFNAEIYFKYFAFYPVFLALAIIKKEDWFSNVILGLLLGLAYFIHPLTLVIVSILPFVYIKRYKFSKRFFTKSFFSFAPTCLMLIGWMLFARFAKQSAGINLAEDANIYVSKLSSLEANWWINKLINIVNIFAPNTFSKSFSGGFNDAEFLNNFISNFFRLSFISAMSPIFLFMIGFSLLKKQLKEYWDIFFYGIGPLFIFVLAIHSYSMGGYAIFYPFILPFLWGLVVARLNPMNKIYRLLTTASFPLSMLASLYYFSGVFIRIKCASSMVHGLFWAILICYFIISGILLKLVFEPQEK